MKDIAPAVTALLTFLIPLGLYCMLLAFVNRRTKPLMVRGIWDAVGLLGAMSGFLLWTMPTLIDEFCQRVFDVVEGPYLYSGLWIIYFVVLAFFSALMVFLRVAKTTIYNVDTHVFNTIFEQTMARMGLSIEMNRGRLLLTPAQVEAGTENAFAVKPTGAAPVANDRRFAELTVENFASMSHVTLHWSRCAPYLRRQIEEELERGLELAAPDENAAAGWFYTVTGLIFGSLFLVAAMILMSIYFSRQ